MPRREGKALWLLTRTEKEHPGDVRFEVNHAILVRSLSPRTARKMAAAVAIDEPPEIWQDPRYSHCTYLGEAKGKYAEEEGVLLQENNAS